MLKKIIKIIKLQIPAGKANPAPPIGPALGQAGLNIAGFCKDFNAKTQDKIGKVLPVEITVYHDKTYSFVTKEEPNAEMIKKAAGKEKGSATPNRLKVGQLTTSQVRKIAEAKKQDMNAASIEAAMRTIMGSARSMGIEIIAG